MKANPQLLLQKITDIFDATYDSYTPDPSLEAPLFTEPFVVTCEFEMTAQLANLILNPPTQDPAASPSAHTHIHNCAEEMRRKVGKNNHLIHRPTTSTTSLLEHISPSIVIQRSKAGIAIQLHREFKRVVCTFACVAGPTTPPPFKDNTSCPSSPTGTDTSLPSPS